MIRMSVLAATALAGAALATPALAGEVTVTLTNVRADAGDLYVSLQSEAQFMQAAALAGKTVENPKDGTVTVTFDDVPDGQYALMVWHDIDGDGTFSMGPQGPTDGWSMIGADALRGMPTFAAQSFTLDGSATVTEPVLYPRDGE
ncbi:DUF2141 domain-containing protein [Citromicrobium bathyomarinum]|uniref:DUF2141 domain-containing protein n=1 Tax=Citromicrobium TaxID=72173 RepID=UPI0001DD10ED|nr:MULTISPECIES: DUF2141 domain-containing protein [Citromicrobium]ALG60830.1 hypothetical protein WG74_08300 [Citromicrobium sp. JL477]KPM13359.1 hypothetical protein VO58_12515 [Citromicrobium sp. JL1351]KPM14827.1 hypothetical protein VM77_12740 [Citromicrobium sp. JL31]KPM22323.1 hypothetical protein VO57_12845 [Citromicrobium sp. JL2201]MCD1623881.1 DUF2141 domain-containing protein [Citromicrobium bathyomarinum]